VIDGSWSLVDWYLYLVGLSIIAAVVAHIHHHRRG